MAIREKIGKVSYVHKGIYNSSTTYNRLDVVNYNGSSYVSRTDNNTSSPTDTSAWTLLAYSPVKGTDYWTTQELADFVQKTDPETIPNKFTFTTLPEANIDPTTNNQFTRKKYVDDNVANINGFLLNGTNPTKIKDFLTMMRAMLVTEGEYGVEWDLFATNNSSSCTKLYDNVGLSITPGTDSVAEVNNYPKIFESIDCNYININGEDIITSLKGMSNYGETPSEIQDVTIDGVTYTPDVGTIHFSRYEKYGINSSGKFEYSMSWIPKEGYNLIDLGKDKNGNFKPYFIIAKCVAGYDSNGKIRSAFGLDPACQLNGTTTGTEDVSHPMSYTACINAFHARGDYYSAALMSEYGFIMRDFWLKFATRNTQSIMAGNTSNNYQYAVATAETGVHRVVLTNAQAANIDLLSCVSVGDRGTATNNDRINKYLHNICKSARVIAKETVDTDHTALILDHANFNTTSTTYVSTMHERSGYSRFVRGRYGSPINNTNGKHGMVFNGIEIAVGGYEVAGNAILDIIDNTGKREVYVTNNATKLSGTVATIKDTYTKSSLSIQPTTLNAWNYITRYDYDLTNGLMVPTEAGQSGSGTSTGFADGLYVDNATSGQRECLWLGLLSNFGLAGLSCLFEFWIIIWFLVYPRSSLNKWCKGVNWPCQEGNPP